MSMNETWLPIPGWEGNYEVSNLGRVRGVSRVVLRRNGTKQPIPSRSVRQFLDTDGRPSVQLYFVGGRKSLRVHRLVALAFLGPQPAGMEVCHNDGDKQNNNLTNLRWDTRAENELDRVRHGTHNHASKTHCLRGHPLSGPNVKVAESPRGRITRHCMACRRYRDRASRRAVAA